MTFVFHLFRWLIGTNVWLCLCGLSFCGLSLCGLSLGLWYFFVINFYVEMSKPKKVWLIKHRLNLHIMMFQYIANYTNYVLKQIGVVKSMYFRIIELMVFLLVITFIILIIAFCFVSVSIQVLLLLLTILCPQIVWHSFDFYFFIPLFEIPYFCKTTAFCWNSKMLSIKLKLSFLYFKMFNVFWFVLIS